MKPSYLVRSSFGAGPSLTAVFYHPSVDEENVKDVTSACLPYVMHPVDWQAPTLGEVFELLRRNATVVDLFGDKADYVRDCLELSKTPGPSPWPGKGVSLVLSAESRFSTRENEQAGPVTYAIHAEVSWANEPGRPLTYGLQDIPVNCLLDAPIRYVPEVMEVEGDFDSENWDNMIRSFKQPKPRLIELLLGVIQALHSFDASTR